MQSMLAEDKPHNPHFDSCFAARSLDQLPSIELLTTIDYGAIAYVGALYQVQVHYIEHNYLACTRL